MITRLDEIRSDTECRSFWASHHCAIDYLYHGAVRHSDCLGDSQDLRRSPLESISDPHHRPAVDDVIDKGWHVLCWLGSTGQSACALYRAQFSGLSHGSHDPLAQLHQHSARFIHYHDHWHCRVSMELCQPSHYVHHVSFELF